MNTSVIRQRVADFLQRHAPFDALSAPDLLDLAGSGRVKFHESEEYIFRQGQAKGPVVWIIQQGRVELLDESVPGDQLRDVVGEGDLLGLDRFAGDGSCPYSVRTATDVILYGISANLFESLVAGYPAVKRFVSAHFSAAGILGFGRTSWLDAGAPPLAFLRARNGHAAGHQDLPAIALPSTARPAVREMLRAGVDQVAITADGFEAVLTAADLALFCNRNPARLIDTIRQARSAAEIAPLLPLAKKLVMDGLAQPHDIDDCCQIGAVTIAAVADACIRLARAGVLESGIDPPAEPSCWAMFGASARGDLLTPGLPTIAPVYDDSAAGYRPEDSVFFAALAGETGAWFHACGLDGEGWSWPEGSHPSMPLSEWKRFYTETIRDPLDNDLWGRREFFDVWPLDGERSTLQVVRDAILLELRDHPMAVLLLANDTLSHTPPLTFFRGLVVHLDGGEQDSFDLESAALAPIADAARVFALAKRRLTPANTMGRLEAAALDYPEGAAVLRDAAEAFRIALYYRTLAGSSRIEPGELGKFDQRLLKTAFSSIQRLLEFTADTFIPLT